MFTIKITQLTLLTKIDPLETSSTLFTVADGLPKPPLEISFISLTFNSSKVQLLITGYLLTINICLH